MAPAPQQAPPKQILCEGLLGLKKKRGVEQRYFVLYEEGLLNYYLDRQGFVDGLEPRGRVNIDDVDVFKEHNSGFQLEIDGKMVDFVSVPGGDSDMRPWANAIETQMKVRRGELAEEGEDDEAEEDEEKVDEAAAPGNDAEEAAGNAEQQGPLCRGLLEVSRKGKSHSRYFVLHADRMEYFSSADDFAAGAESRGKVLTMSHVIGFKEHSGGFTVMLESEGVPQAPLDFKGSEEELVKWYPVWRKLLKSSLAEDYQELPPPAPAKQEQANDAPAPAEETKAAAAAVAPVVQESQGKAPPKKAPPQEAAAAVVAPVVQESKGSAPPREARGASEEQAKSDAPAPAEEAKAAESPASASAEAGSAARPKSPARGISFRASVASVQSSRASTASRRQASPARASTASRRPTPPEPASPARLSAVSTKAPSRPSSPPSRPSSPASRQSSRKAAAPGRESQSTASGRAASPSVSPRQAREKVLSEDEQSAEQKRASRGGSIRRQASTASQGASRTSRTPPSPAPSPRPPRSMKPPWFTTMGAEGVLASGLLTMQGLGVTGEEVYCVLLPDRFLWSQAKAADPSSVLLANVRSVDMLVGGFEMEFFDQGDEQWSPRGGGTSKVQLRVGGPDAAARAEAGSERKLAKMSTDELRRERQVEQALHKWEEALHKVDWATLTQDHESRESLHRVAAESPRTAQSLSPRGGSSPRSPRSPRGRRPPAEAKLGLHQEQPRCQGRLGFSVHGTLQWRYAMLFGDRLDAWESKEAALVGMNRGACPPTRITMSTLQSLEIVDQGFLLKCAGAAHGVHVGPDQTDLGRWSSALARTLSESRLAAATSTATSPRSSGKPRTPSSGQGGSSTGSRSLNRHITFFTARAQSKARNGKMAMKIGVPMGSKDVNTGRTTPKVNTRDSSNVQSREAFFDSQFTGKITGHQRSITPPPRKDEVRWNKAVHTPVLVDRGLDGSGSTNVPAKVNEVRVAQSAVGPPLRIESRQDPADRRQFKPNHQFP